MLRYKELDGITDYFIREDGKVFHGERELKTHLDKNGYVQIGITTNGKTKTYKVHRLVAKAFIPNVLNLKEVNHLDGDKRNNDVSNLEWCDHKHNLGHASKMKLFRYGENHQHSKISQKDADEIRVLYKKGGKSQGKLAEMYGISRAAVYRILHNHTYIRGD